eukprot:3083558-Amphidinium_carterae.1
MPHKECPLALSGIQALYNSFHGKDAYHGPLVVSSTLMVRKAVVLLKAPFRPRQCRSRASGLL